MAGHPPRTTDERLDDPRVARHAVTTSGRTTATMVTVDQELLKRVFENLVLNAAQAVTIPGTIAVDTSVTGAICRVAVTNTGTGSAAPLRKRIVEPFFTTKRGGTGLGLPISRHVVRLHGGELQLADSGPHQTTVLVALPLALEA